MFRTVKRWIVASLRSAVERAQPDIAQIKHQTERTVFFVERLAIMEKERYVSELLTRDRYVDPKRLESFGFKTYSQNDEDGIIQEIFNRIGTTTRRFIEIGVENGLECNTLKLLLEGWSGLWLEGSSQHLASITRRFNDIISEGRLSAKQAFVTAENINELIADGDIDLLSIDIDGNDFYVWRTIRAVNPRVVVIEFNAKFRPPLSIVQAYRPDNVWPRTDYMGASLEAMVRLGRDLGYSLVGTNIVGVNAFFVRNDLLAEHFQEPFTAENHYNEPRYFLWPLYQSGHTPDWGRYENIP
jgi:hypothetical protein